MAASPSHQFLFQPSEDGLSPRLFDLSTNDTNNLITLNRTQLGDAAGIVLASTFFTAAVIANLPEQLTLNNIRKAFRKKGTNDRADGVDVEDDKDSNTCDCEETCYNEYLRGYYDSYEAHYGGTTTTADRVKRE